MSDENILQIFNASAARFNSNLAIAGTDRSITYGELDCRSNNLANFLLASEFKKGSIVAIVAEDSIEAIGAIIAVIKAGGVFVPLDPSMPKSRLETILKETAPRWAIVEQRFISAIEQNVEGISRPQTICIAPAGSANAQAGPLLNFDYSAVGFNTDLPAVERDPDDLAYIYFTSGSTGTPKGIAGRFSAIAHFIKWEASILGINEGARVSQLAPLSFDASLRDIFLPLSTGGVVCVPEGRDMIVDARRLVRWIDENRINVVHCTPSLFRSIINDGLTPNHFADLKYVLMAGERLLPNDVARWTDIFGERIQLINLYGPSETTMVKFSYFVKPSDRTRQTIPIGKAIDGARAVLVDDKGRPSAPGAVGEIYIRTAFRSLGYFNRPDLTEKVFIKNPFSDDPNDIVYKTGDYGRMLEDGNFEFLGRKDDQVKIRGVRVELGEVENSLREQEHTLDVAVIDREDANGFTFLCAYVVLKEGGTIEALRDHLLGCLPESMIPSAFVVMDALPRTITGKIDRLALPDAHQANSAQAAIYEPPRTPIEEDVVSIWGQILGYSRIGIHDNFFLSGGHSLLATQLLSRVRNEFEVEISLRLFFDSPTVAGLALAITQHRITQENEYEMAMLIEEIKQLSDDVLEQMLDEEKETVKPEEAR